MNEEKQTCGARDTDERERAFLKARHVAAAERLAESYAALPRVTGAVIGPLYDAIYKALLAHAVDREEQDAIIHAHFAAMTRCAIEQQDRADGGGPALDDDGGGATPRLQAFVAMLRVHAPEAVAALSAVSQHGGGLLVEWAPGTALSAATLAACAGAWAYLDTGDSNTECAVDHAIQERRPG